MASACKQMFCKWRQHIVLSIAISKYSADTSFEKNIERLKKIANGKITMKIWEKHSRVLTFMLSGGM